MLLQNGYNGVKKKISISLASLHLALGQVQGVEGLVRLRPCLAATAPLRPKAPLGPLMWRRLVKLPRRASS